MRVFVSLAAIALSVVFAPRAVQQASPPAKKGVRLADITWQQAADVLRPETVVVIPLGAGSKEHGPHLKLSNDASLAEYLTNRVLEAADVVVAPPLAYHYYPAFTGYPGSTSLTLETARALTTESALGLSRFGPRRFYVLNTGVSTAIALEPAARALASEGVLLGYTDLASRLDLASAGVRQETGGTHADEIETSMMLYIDPGSVDMRAQSARYTPATGSLHLTRRRGAPGTFSESGVWGDPTLATREKGRVVVEALVAGILEDIESLRRARRRCRLLEQRDTASSRRAGDGPAGRDSPGCVHPGDERTLRSIGDALTLHWRNADAAQLAALWAADGDMVHPDGLTERGRETIRANRAALFLRREGPAAPCIR